MVVVCVELAVVKLMVNLNLLVFMVLNLMGMFLPGESQGQGSLLGCRLWGRTESDTTEATQQQQQQYCFTDA